MKPIKLPTVPPLQSLAYTAVLALAALPAARAADYPSTVLADKPVAYYRLEETSGSTAADSSGNALDGVYSFDGGYPLLGQAGIDTNSVSLHSGTLGYVTAGYYAALNPQGPFSFEVWTRPTSAPTGGDYRCPIGNFTGWGLANGWYVYQTPDPGSTFTFIMQGSPVWIGTSYSLFTWYHLVGTYDGTNGAFYVNGNLIGSASGNGFVANSVTALGIGERGDGYGTFDGNLDEVAIYTNALSIDRIKAHYQVGTNSFRTPPVGATVRSDPASATQYEGHTVQFSVLADGTPPLVYQWYKGTSKISGATGTAYSFVCATADDASTYQVIVTNNYGSATSAVATLTVSTGLLVDDAPMAITRNVGSVAAFHVVVEGALPLGYQWYKGTSLIAGATDATLWLPKVAQADDQTTYYVHVSNPYTSQDTASVTLTVQARAANAMTNLYSKIVMLDAPVAYWRLNETDGTTALDTVGTFDGTYDLNAGAGTVTYGLAPGAPHDAGDTAAGITNGARVIVPYAFELNPWGPFSAEGWFKPASLAANGNDYRTAVSSISDPAGAGPTGWLLYQQGNNTWAWVVYGGLWANAFITDTSEVITANQWYHVVLTYDGTVFTLYVNGVARSSAPYSGFVPNGDVPSGSTGYVYTYNGSSAFNIGWRSDSTQFNPFSGAIDEVAFYNKALTAQQVQNHFTANVRLSIARSGNNAVLTWPLGTLQAAPSATGTYTNITAATSPYTNAIGGSKTFYRVQLQ